jgi:enamine deaminase RidA (YjgF/YER057c/UK114 family)
MRCLMLAGLLIATPAAARDKADVLMPTDPKALAFQNDVGYADAVRAGDTLYLSGVVAGPAPGEQGLVPAYERAFAHIASILKRAGASWDDVVDITTYHMNVDAELPDLTVVKNRYVKAPFPTWTVIQVARLYEPSVVTEIKVTAYKPKR